MAAAAAVVAPTAVPSTRTVTMNSTMPSPVESAILAATGSSYSRRPHSSTTASFPKHRPNALRTPLSATYPSSLHSPALSTPGPRTATGDSRASLKPDVSTPLTPPSAYLDFLNKMSPSVCSPGLNSALSAATHFSFSAMSPTVMQATSVPRGTSAFSAPPPPRSSEPKTSALTRPPLNSVPSYGSTTSETSTATESVAANTGRPISRSNSLAGPPRRPSLIIPPSPTTRSPSIMSPASANALNTAGSMRSPRSAAPFSAMPLSARSATGSGQTARVTVRYSVTRTVTYTRTPTSAKGKGPGMLPPTSAPPVKADNDEAEVPAVKTEDESSAEQKRPLVGEAPKGKRRRLDQSQGTAQAAEKAS